MALRLPLTRMLTLDILNTDISGNNKLVNKWLSDLIQMALSLTVTLDNTVVDVDLTVSEPTRS